MRKSCIFLLFSIFLFTSCKKEEDTNWNVKGAVPLAKSRLNIINFLPDSLYDTDPDGNLLLTYEKEIFSFGLDSVLDIPATTVEEIFNFSWISEVELDENYQLYFSERYTDLGSGQAELSEITIRNGTLHIAIENSIEGEMVYTYEMPGTTLNGSIFSSVFTVPAAANGNNSLFEIDLDLAGYHVDLTGEDGTDFNQIFNRFIIRTPASGGTTTLTGQDSVILSASISNIEIDYAKGYFGTSTLSSTTENTEFDIFNELQESLINIDNALVVLTMENGFGADVNATISEISALNSFTEETLGLNHNLLGNPVNLNRATDYNGSLEPSTFSVEFNADNSNINGILSMLPTALNFTSSAGLNPLGNVSNYNDFAYYESKLKAILSVTIPLNISFSNVVFTDTVDLSQNPDNFEDVLSAKIFAKFENYYPLNIEMEFTFLDADNNPILKFPEAADPAFEIPTASGEFNNITASEGLLIMEMDHEELIQFSNAKKIIIRGVFETDQYPTPIQFRPEQYLDVNLSAIFDYKVTVQ